MSAILPYWLFVPAGYEARQAAWPLLLYLHGGIEIGEEDAMEDIKRSGPPRIAECQPDFPFVLVSPYCPRPHPSLRSGWDVDLLVGLLDEIVPQLHVDRSRIYVTGPSMGGYATWRIVARYPQRIAAAVPIGGGGEPDLAGRIAQVPIWCFHGEKDSIVPIEQSEHMVDAVLQAGGHIRFTIYPGADHQAWPDSYADPGLYDWLRAHAKEPGTAERA